MLEAFFKPRSIAIIGASSNPAKLGYAVVRNLVEGGYAQHRPASIPSTWEGVKSWAARHTLRCWTCQARSTWP